MCYHAESGRSRSNSWCVVTEIIQKSLTLRVPPFKVTGTDMDRSPTYDFVLVFCSNCGPISYCFRDKWQYLQNLPTMNILHPCWGGSPWNFIMAVMLKWCPYQNVKKFDELSIHLDIVLAMDGQTEGHKCHKKLPSLHADAW